MEEIQNKKTAYEYAFLLKLGTEVSELKQMLAKHGIEITSEGPMTELKLAYPIAKQTTALFGYFGIVIDQLGESDPLQALNKETELDQNVLRTLVVKPPKERKQKESKGEGKPAKRREQKEEIIPKVDRIESLSNEKLEETLEEILK